MSPKDAVPEKGQLIDKRGAMQFEVGGVSEIPLEMLLDLHIDIDMRLIHLVFPVEQKVGKPDGSHAGLRGNIAFDEGHDLFKFLHLIQGATGFKA